MNQKEDIKVLRKYLKQYRDCYARLKDIERRLMNTRSDEEQRKLNSAYAEATIHIRNVYRIIKLTDDEKERRILELHYLDGKSWEGISKNVNYSYGYCTHIEEAALRKLVNCEEIKNLLKK